MIEREGEGVGEGKGGSVKKDTARGIGLLWNPRRRKREKSSRRSNGVTVVSRNIYRRCGFGPFDSWSWVIDGSRNSFGPLMISSCSFGKAPFHFFFGFLFYFLPLKTKEPVGRLM